MTVNLNLEAVGSSAATSPFELSAVGSDTGLNTVVGMRVVDGGSMAEEFNRLTGIFPSSQEDGVRALG